MPYLGASYMFLKLSHVMARPVNLGFASSLSRIASSQQQLLSALHITIA